jgi:predicted AAA+ superfamily ATPase
MVIKREIYPRIQQVLFKKKAVILYGARQVGKTTLLRELEKQYKEQSLYLNCDEPDIRSRLTEKTSTELKALFGQARLVFIDEAQRVRDIGLTIKLIVDMLPEVQIIASGSSSFELSNRVAEPLTGRVVEFHLYPFSLSELCAASNDLDVSRLLERRMVVGMYPEIVMNDRAAESHLASIARSYLYKDVLEYHQIKKPEALEKLLQALALQIGSEVSYSELATLVGVEKQTIQQYIHLLEQAFILFRLPPFQRNLRTELRKLRKIYFVDVGVRNTIIKNMNPLNLRQDVGGLWENFVMSERMKWNANRGRLVNTYFWRTHAQQELDYLEEEGGKLHAFEFKWASSKVRIPKAFREAYPQSSINVVTKENILDFVR